MISGVYIIYAHIPARKTMNYVLNKWKIVSSLAYLTCTRLLAGSQCCIQPAIQCATWWRCLRLRVCSKKWEGAYAWATTRQHSIRCNMYTLPSNSTMHSYMRRFACRPIPIYLSSMLSLKIQFLWLGFPLCAFVAGHDTLFISCTNALFSNSLYTCALLIPMPIAIACLV